MKGKLYLLSEVPRIYDDLNERWEPEGGYVVIAELPQGLLVHAAPGKNPEGGTEIARSWQEVSQKMAEHRTKIFRAVWETDERDENGSRIVKYGTVDRMSRGAPVQVIQTDLPPHDFL